MSNVLLPHYHSGVVAQPRVVGLRKILVFQLIYIADEEVCHFSYSEVYQTSLICLWCYSQCFYGTHLSEESSLDL